MATQSFPADHRHPIPEVQKLRDIVELMDHLSQSGFSQIASIASLALARLEAPEAYQHLDDIANALEAIRGTANDIQNCINAHAEEVGCHYVDKAQRWRWEAWRLAQDQIRGADHE